MVSRPPCGLDHFGFQGVAFQRGVDAFVAPSVLVSIDGAIAAAHAHGINVPSHRTALRGCPRSRIRKSRLDRCTPHASTTPMYSSWSSHNPSPSASASQSPPHTPAASSTLPSNRTRPRRCVQSGVDRPRQSFALVVARLGIVAPLARLDCNCRRQSWPPDHSCRQIHRCSPARHRRCTIHRRRGIPIARPPRPCIRHTRPPTHLEDIPKLLVLNALLEDPHLDLA